MDIDRSSEKLELVELVEVVARQRLQDNVTGTQHVACNGSKNDSQCSRVHENKAKMEQSTSHHDFCANARSRMHSRT